MHLLFSAKNLASLKNIATKQTLFAFDFDGTLSKINKDILGAKIATSTQKYLCDLSNYAPVAIVSGRSIDDLKSRLQVPKADLIGNHGLEGLSEWKNELKDAKLICKKWLLFLQKQQFVSGVIIENKIFSISIHFREVKDKKNLFLKLSKVIEDLKPTPRIIHGKSVINIIPENSPNKGTAILKLKKIRKVKHVFYIGDDDTDEDVFVLQNPSILKIRVGKKKNSKAEYYINRQSQINKLLKTIINYFETNKKNLTKQSAK